MVAFACSLAGILHFYFKQPDTCSPLIKHMFNVIFNRTADSSTTSIPIAPLEVNNNPLDVNNNPSNPSNPSEEPALVKTTNQS